MRILNLTLIAFSLLAAGCGNGSGNKSSGGFSVASQALTGGCPMLNGTYANSSPNGDALEVQLATKVEDSTYSYRFGDETDSYYAADGSEIHIKIENGQSVALKVSCGNNAVVFNVKMPDQAQADEIVITDLGDGHVRYASGGHPIELTKR